MRLAKTRSGVALIGILRSLRGLLHVILSVMGRHEAFQRKNDMIWLIDFKKITVDTGKKTDYKGRVGKSRW